MDAVILDPEIVPLLELASALQLSVDALPALRDLRNTQFQVELSDAVERTDRVVSEDPYLVVRVHRPKGVAGPLPCVYSIHGGGYVLGSHEMDDARFDTLCTRFPCVGVSVEYRLAPETPYPGPLEDCYAGLHGRTTTPTSSASTAPASASAASAPAAGSPPGWRCSRATGVKFRWPSSSSTAP